MPAARSTIAMSLTRRAFCASLLSVVGCSPWLKAEAEKPMLPPLAAPASSVELEIAFAHLATEEWALEQSLWQQFDEQAIPLEQRRRLNANGFRLGLVGTQIPARLNELVNRTVAETQQAPDSDSIAGEDTPVLSQRRLQLLPGKRGKIVVSTTYPTLSILSVDEEQHVRGQLFSSAQCLFSIKAFPAGDGGARVEITPEIEHGDVKNRWVPIDGALVQQIGKDRHAYDTLTMQHQLQPGQTLLMGSTDQPCGVARPFFFLEQPTQRRLLLVVRLANAQPDDLFSPRTTASELTSVRE
jgi:hypothetical protein